MKILFVNCTCGIGSTGKIVAAKAKEYIKDGHQVKIAYGRIETIPDDLKPYAVRIGTKRDLLKHVVLTRILDMHGLGSRKATRDFVKWASQFSPDLLWLHNIHGYYINYEVLFEWIKSNPGMEVRWTLHDCWAFTGHCVHFETAHCEKWKKGCSKCCLRKTYPSSLVIDHSKNNYYRKKTAFQGVKKMSLITPSKWLGNLVSQSLLREYPVNVIYNTIDKTIFCPRSSSFREDIDAKDKTIVLGVASDWYNKGLKDFIKLSSILGDNYIVVLVGLTKREISCLPVQMIGIERTLNQEKLAEIYTAADVFVNLTYQDTYPTVNLEAQACGTPCVTYRTGGSPESVPDQNVVNQGDIEEIANVIRQKKYIL